MSSQKEVEKTMIEKYKRKGKTYEETEMIILNHQSARKKKRQKRDSTEEAISAVMDKFPRKNSD